MTDPKDAERLAMIRLQNDGLPTVPPGHSDIVFLLRLVDGLTAGRDALQARVAAAERTISIYAKDVTALRQECDEARRSAEALATAARNFRDDATGSLESQNRLWDTLDAAAQPATNDVALARIETALENDAACAIIDKLQKLAVNVRYWVAHGCSETAVKALDEAMADGWAAMGYKDLIRR